MTERTPGQADNGQPDTTPRRDTGEPLLSTVVSWAVLSASFGLSAATWIALAKLAGFTGQLHVHARGTDVTVELAWLMPVAVDGYVVSALVLWLSAVSPRVAAFAKRNTYAAALAGVAAQSAYHGLSASGAWWHTLLAGVIGFFPPALAAGAVHMRALLRNEAGQAPAKRAANTRPAAATSATVRRPAANAAPAVTRPPVDAPAPDTRVPAVTGQPDTVRPAIAGRPATGQSDTGQPANGQPATGQSDTAKVIPLPARTVRAGQVEVSVEELAAALSEKFGGQPVGRPTAQAHLRQVFGTCSGDRAIEAKNLHNARLRGQHTAPTEPPAEEDPEPDRQLAATGT